MPRGLSGSLGLGLGSLFGMMPLVCGCVTAHWGKMVVSNLACWVGITAPPTAGWLSKGIPLSERNSSRSQYCWNQIKNNTLIKTKQKSFFFTCDKDFKKPGKNYGADSKMILQLKYVSAISIFNNFT